MRDARSAILQRVRQAQRTARIPTTSYHPPSTGPDTTVTVGAELARPSDLLARFLAESTTLGVTHHVESSAEDVRARVRAIVGDRTVLAWDADRLPYEVGSVVPGAATGASPRDVQAAAEIGVTGCDAAVAETGSLVMLSGPGKPRAASLLPPVHVCVVRMDDLGPSMGDLFAGRARDIADSACCTFITGPSRTADIELTLTLGVHGPGKVIVVVGP
jgi:L-lactate dehydrogenase complex protein LldG